MHWRAVYCKPREERRALLHLLNQDFEAFLPRLRSRRRRGARDLERVEPMFPRYLFLKLSSAHQDWGPIRSTRGVVGLVRFGDQVPVVPDALVERLRALEDESGLIDLNRCQPPRENEIVEITAGPLAGLRGLFEAETGQQRAMVLLEILNRQHRVQLPLRDLRRA